MDDIRDFEAKDGADHVGLGTKSVDDLHEESMMLPGLSEAAFRQLPSAYRKKMPTAKSIYVLDFFAGCGGMSYGFATTRQSHVDIKVLGGFDINKVALKTYERNVPGGNAIEANVSDLAESPERIKELIPGFEPATCRPLVFIGCAPCQGFSAQRKKDPRNDPRNSLMVAFAKICEHFKPDAVVQENVPEIITGRYSQYHEEALSILHGSGYQTDQAVLDLSMFGVPQRRRRAIILSTLNGKIDLPKPIFSKEAAPTVRDAISHLAPIQAGEADPSDPFHRAPMHTARILDRISRTPADGGDRRDLSKHDQLDCHSNLDTGKTPGFTDVYGRLRWDTPSVTITAKSSTPSCGRFLHPEQHRNISVREAAILQGFPQTYQFEGAFVNQYRQIGEAVPPLFARSIAWTVLDHFFPKAEQAEQKKRVPTKPKSKPRAQKPLVVDGFCGAGGIALGFKASGFETAFAFDTDASAVETFAKNVSGNVRCVSIADQGLEAEIASKVSDRPFVIVGGPPCQGFSQQRRGDPIDKRNNLVVEFAELVSKLPKRPQAVVLENVTYLDSPRGRHIFEAYSSRMEQLGYKLFRHNLNSADFGVAQLRRRIVSVAVRAELANLYQGPQPISGVRWPTVGEAFTGLPTAQENTSLNILKNHVPSREGPLNKRRVAYVDMGMGRMSVPEALQLNCHSKYGGHLDVYGRLDWFAQARTITGGFDSFTRGEYAHPFEHRSITPREAARLQGFPDNFEFIGNRSAIRHQIGNAVPPPMAEAIGKALIDIVKA